MLKLEQTEKILRGLVDAGWMGSYALLVRHGSEKAAITGKNVDADTLFEVASLTKVTVTAPLAMMSIAEGKLALEDHLGDFFSGLTVMRDVTVFRLLTHTSGIGAIPFSFVLTDRGSQAVAAAICRAGRSSARYGNRRCTLAATTGTAPWVSYWRKKLKITWTNSAAGSCSFSNRRKRGQKGENP